MPLDPTDPSVVTIHHRDGTKRWHADNIELRHRSCNTAEANTRRAQSPTTIPTRAQVPPESERVSVSEAKMVVGKVGQLEDVDLEAGSPELSLSGRYERAFYYIVDRLLTTEGSLQVSDAVDTGHNRTGAAGETLRRYLGHWASPRTGWLTIAPDPTTGKPLITRKETP